MSSSRTRRTLAATEYEICRKILEAFGDANLMVQLDHTEVVVGSPPMHIDLVVNPGQPRSGRRDGPLPINTSVVSDAGTDYGEILIWITDGYLSGIEHPWWSDEMPAAWPAPTNVRIEGRSVSGKV